MSQSSVRWWSWPGERVCVWTDVCQCLRSSVCECLQVSSCLSNITIFSYDTPFAVKGDKSEGWKKEWKNVGFGKSLSGKPLCLCSHMFLYRRENISFREMFPLQPFSLFLTQTEMNHITHSTPCYQFVLKLKSSQTLLSSILSTFSTTFIFI